MLDSILVARPSRQTLIETAGPAILIVLPLDGEPRIEYSDMTLREAKAFRAHRENDIRFDVILDAWDDVESLRTDKA